MIDVLAESGRADEAFNFAERARSRALLDLIGSKAQLSSLASGFLRKSGLCWNESPAAKLALLEKTTKLYTARQSHRGNWRRPRKRTPLSFQE